MVSNGPRQGQTRRLPPGQTGWRPVACYNGPIVPGFVYHHDLLTCDDTSLVEIAQHIGTPCYVYSGSLIRGRHAELSAAFHGYPHALHYALKANSTLALLRLLRSLGADADANSIGEIDVALRAGYTPAQIVFTGVGKTRDELERAVGLGLKAINAESAGELDRIDQIARAQGTRARVALRVNPDVDAGSHPHISTGLKRNKFGVPVSDARALLNTMQTRGGLEIVGVHFHLGSQMTTLDPLRRAADTLVGLVKELQQDGLPLEHVDLGGGLGIDYKGEAAGAGGSAVPDAVSYAAVLLSAARSTGLSLIVEPGRTMVGSSGVLLSRVVDIKPAPEGRQFVVIDASMTELIRPALYGAYHRILPVRQNSGAREIVADIVGPVCETSDTFGVERTVPAPQVDDLVAIMDAGAYGIVMSSNYNRRPMPPEVLVDGGEWKVIRRRQTVDDMLACEA
jgi:diaminopimelate decarboxylase